MAISGKLVTVKRRLVHIIGSQRLPRQPFGLPRNDKIDGLYRSSSVVIARRRPQGRRRGNLKAAGHGKMAVGSYNRFPEIATSLASLVPRNDKIDSLYRSSLSLRGLKGRGNLKAAGHGKTPVGSYNRFPEIAGLALRFCPALRLRQGKLLHTPQLFLIHSSLSITTPPRNKFRGGVVI